MGYCPAGTGGGPSRGTFTRRAHENDDWRTELNAFWQTWVDRMNLALPDLMVAQTHTRASLFSFSRQMQGSREPLEPCNKSSRVSTT